MAPVLWFVLAIYREYIEGSTIFDICGHGIPSLQALLATQRPHEPGYAFAPFAGKIAELSPH
jgi:hypothetical protein